jgi:hypothetical protein
MQPAEAAAAMAPPGAPRLPVDSAHLAVENARLRRTVERLLSQLAQVERERGVFAGAAAAAQAVLAAVSPVHLGSGAGVGQRRRRSGDASGTAGSDGSSDGGYSGDGDDSSDGGDSDDGGGADAALPPPGKKPRM